MQMDDTQALCQCGCGEPAPIATRTYSQRGIFKGQPFRYRFGHHARRPRGGMVIGDTTVKVPLYGKGSIVRGYAIIDATDAEWADQYRWHLNGGYARRGEHPPEGGTRSFAMHRELLGLSPADKIQVDHINRDTLDNRRRNLRTATHSENMQNTSGHAGTSSCYRGVSWSQSRQRWQAYLSAGGRKITIGRYRTEGEAHEAVRAARLRLMPYATD